jgi:hypothetical protein
MRVKKSDLIAMEQRINRQLNKLNADFRVTVQWAYGQPRAYKCELTDRYGCLGDLSPRLPMGQMYDWLGAYSYGLEVERKAEVQT